MEMKQIKTSAGFYTTIFEPARFGTLPQEAIEAFSALECRLSPENLACDGECSRTETQRRYRQCMKEWKALEKKYKVKIEPLV